MTTTPDTRAAIPAQRAFPISVGRAMGLETAAKMLGGQAELAAALIIAPRSLRAKLAMDRGISDDDMLAAAQALEHLAERALAHAAKLRAEIQSVSPSERQPA